MILPSIVLSRSTPVADRRMAIFAVASTPLWYNVCGIKPPLDCSATSSFWSLFQLKFKKRLHLPQRAQRAQRLNSLALK